jgi:hypothetical protein
MKVPFHIHIQLAVDYESTADERCDIRDLVENVLKDNGIYIVSIGAGPYPEEKD